MENIITCKGNAKAGLILKEKATIKATEVLVRNAVDSYLFKSEINRNVKGNTGRR